MKSKFLVIIAIISTGILGTIIYPTVLFGHRLPDFGFLAWIYLIPLLLALNSLKGIRLFLAGFLSSAIFYTGSLYWMVLAMKNFGGLSLTQSCGVLALVILILSFFFSAALAMAFWTSRQTGFPIFFLIAIFVMSFDFLRTYFPVNGFPWPMTAYSQGEFLPYFQWVDATGVYGLNILIILVNGLLAEMILARFQSNQKDRLISRFIILFLIVAVSFAGSIYQQKKHAERTPGESSYQMALIQGNISQDMKWDRNKARENLSKYLYYTDRAAVDGAQLAVWPESSYPYVLNLFSLNSIRFLDRKTLPIPILFGAISQSLPPTGEKPLYYNSSFLIDKDIQMKGLYHKRHLVPYGEYVPLKKLLSFVKNLTHAVGDFTPGSSVNIMEYGDLAIGNLICYEDIFPDLARSNIKAGANVLVNITNDAWYGNTSAQHQHLIFSQFRALENRRYLVRSTNTGVTALIDPRGEIVEILLPFVEGVMIKKVPLEKKITFYSRFGDYIAWICVFFAILSIVYVLSQKNKRKNYV